MNHRPYKYLVSACLAGFNCRYDCAHKENQRIVDLVKSGEALAACPEEMGGLKTPRPPAEIHPTDEKVMTIEGEDVTKEYEMGASQALELIKNHQINHVILKSKSPMCGEGMIYDGSFTGKLTKGDGVLVQKIRKQNHIKIEKV